MLKVKPVPVPRGYNHPPPPNDVLPKHEFTMGLIAPKGAGKTTVVINLLDFYKGYFHTILVFSPTIDSDEKWDYAKGQKLLGENKALKAWIKEQKNKKSKSAGLVERPEVEVPEIPFDDSYTGYIPEEHFFSEYSDDTFKEIMDEQMNMIRTLKKAGAPKYLANRILIVFDDLVGSTLFSGTRGSYFKGVNTRHRHYSASFLMISQGYKEIPKTIRTNWTALIVFEIGNEQEVKVIYEEYAMGLSWKDWEEVYRYATEEDHSFLFINFQKPKRLRMMKNFQEVLFIEK